MHPSMLSLTSDTHKAYTWKLSSGNEVGSSQNPDEMESVVTGT